VHGASIGVRARAWRELVAQLCGAQAAALVQSADPSSARRLLLQRLLLAAPECRLSSTGEGGHVVYALELARALLRAGRVDDLLAAGSRRRRRRRRQGY
jgi:hypothetical protein